MRRGLVVAPFLAFLIFTLAGPPVHAADHLAPFIHDVQGLRGARQVLTLRRNAERIEVRNDAGSVLASRPYDTTSSVIIDGSAGDDTLVVDFTDGNPIPAGLEFNGGAEVTPEGDIIAIKGGSFEKVVVDFINRSDGTITLDGTVIKYTGLEPVDMSGSTITNLVFNLPAGSDALLQDTGTTTDKIVLLHSVTATFEDVTFAVPTNSLTVNSGGGTTSIATSADFSGDFNTGLTINGSTGTNTVTLGPLALNAGSAVLSVTAQTININGGTISTTGNAGTFGQNFNGPVTLGANTTLTATNSADVTFNMALDGAFALTVNTGGGSNFFGIVGGVTPLTSLSMDAPGLTRVAANVTTTGAQTWADQLALFANDVLTSNGSGTISFAKVDNNFNLTVISGGTIAFNNLVGSQVALLSLTTTGGGTTAINSSVTTNNGQAYGENVSVGGNATLTSNTNGTISFISTINGANSLTVNTGGATMFGGAIGAITPLSILTTDAAGTTAINGGSVTTSGNQNYGDAVTLGANSTLISTSNGDISFNQTLNGAFALTALTGGGTNFFGAVGGNTALTSISTDAPGLTRVAANVTTTGAQTWGDQLALFANVTLTSTGSGAISFAQVDNNFSLTINTAGATTFNAAVGSLVRLLNITTDAAGTTAINGSGITSDAFQTYGDPVTVGANTTLTSNLNGSIVFSAMVNGPNSLTVNTGGATTFTGAIGSITPLGGLTTNAAGTTAINGGLVATTGAQSFNDPVTLGANTTVTSPSSITFAAPIGGGTSGLTKSGAGTMTLSAANTYTGLTNITAGTLAGTGSVAGNLTLQIDAALAPGSGGIGTFTIGGNTTWNGSTTGASTALFDLSNANTTSDRAAITGALLKGSGTSFKFDFQGTGLTGTYTLMTFSSTTFNATNFSFTNLAPGLDGVFSIAGGTALQFTAGSAAATSFLVSGPATATAGTAFNFTVTALDQFGNTATGYGGTVHFTSTDGQAVLPADATLTNGVGTFSATLKTAGSQTLTATDTANTSITGTSNTITVSAAAATHFAVSAPASATAGSAFSFTVTALDQFNNTATSYTGTVHFTSSDGQAVLPANSSLTNGTGTFSSTLKTAGNHTITATDTVTASITGTSNTITVSAAAATHFAVSAPASATAGVAFSFTVTALDPFNNTATGYTGTVHFTSTDGQAVLPANSTLTNGSGTFSATLKTAGTQTITATDTLSASITGTSNAIAVSAAAATHFAVSAPASAAASIAFNFTVTALDQFNNTATGYTGTVHFTSTDAQAVLPANSTLTSGTGTFSATLKTAGNQTITATDTVTASITGTSNTIAVSANAATHFAVSAPASATAGVAFSFTVTALDQFNNTATSYTGIVHFSSTDGQAVLPANSTLTNGSGTFSATLKTAGAQTITATDTASASITGTSNPIVVSAAAATHFAVSAPASATAGMAFNFTVTALDQFNNTATGYAGTVHFSSSDGLAVLPANSGLTNGTGTFSATLMRGGAQTITATDTVAPSVTGTSNAILVTGAGAAIPALTPFALLLLAMTMALIAVIRMRQ